MSPPMGLTLLLVATLLFSSFSVVAKPDHSPFNPLEHSGPASPYFNAPSQSNIDTEIPEGCTVDQVAYIVRHGSRYPEPGSFNGWKDVFAKFQNATYTARGPLSFIPSWTLPVDDEPHQPLFLSSTGAGEAFRSGVDLRKRYSLTKGANNLTVWAASQQRCVDTAVYFLRGYLSQGNYLADPSLNRGTVITLVDSSVNTTFADSLTPSASCPTYTKFSVAGSTNSDKFRATFRGRIAERLNSFLDGLTLNTSDIGVMQDLCGFGFEVGGDKRFCDVFQESEWLDYEYAHDLNYYYGSGPGNPVSAAVGYPWVKAIADLFAAGPGNTVTNGTLTPPSLIMTFTHDNNIPPIISALGLWNSSTGSGEDKETIYPLPVNKRIDDPRRMFHSSYLVSFYGNVALERMTCIIGGPNLEEQRKKGVFHQANVLGGTIKGVEEGKPKVFVRVRANNAPILIPGCTSGPEKTCPLKDFLDYVNGPRKRASGDFVEACGLEGVQGAVSYMKFLTTEGDGTTLAGIV
ncbi:phosphoglycerate mutase-like protein [Marasmius fiardii PR-910]|nr:phosphoglycerate mutase-like protein [Marasmius fiardii PR-910]